MEIFLGMIFIDLFFVADKDAGILLLSAYIWISKIKFGDLGGSHLPDYLKLLWIVLVQERDRNTHCPPQFLGISFVLLTSMAS